VPGKTQKNVYANATVMSDNLDYIDDYFSNGLSAEEQRLFDQRVSDDPAFAGDLAFYVSTMNVMKSESEDERKQRFRTLYEQGKKGQRAKSPRLLVPYLAAAAVIGLISIIIFLFYPVSTPSQLADNYINQNLAVLGVSMGDSQDSVQAALKMYNEGKLNEALAVFEQLNQSHPSDHKLKEYAGIVSLRLGDYDKALKHFHEFEALNLYANPGKFYVALTLLKRNENGDVAEAKKLLQQVTEQRLEHDADARRLLEKL
jgi:tetratricopeptide (TPR) repeat protein